MLEQQFIQTTIQGFITKSLLCAIQAYSSLVVVMQKKFPTLCTVLSKCVERMHSYASGKRVEPLFWRDCVCRLNVWPPEPQIFFQRPNRFEYVETYDSPFLSIEEGFDPLHQKLTLVQTPEGRVICKKNKNTVQMKPPLFEKSAFAYRFLSINYIDSFNKENTIQIDVPDSYYVVGNELFSAVWVARYLTYKHPQLPIHLSYTLEIMDFNLNHLTLTPTQHICLGEESYTIVENKKE